MSKNTVIARPYAKAVFAIAVQQKTIKAWSELLQLAAYVVKQAKVQALLDDPRVTAQQVCEFLLNVCRARLTEEGKNFFKTLAGHDRFAVIPEISELFEEYKAEQERIIKVQVAAASPLNNEEQERIAQTLKKRLQREVVLECKIDSSLIGGLVIQADDLVIDGSIRGKLVRLQTELMS